MDQPTYKVLDATDNGKNITNEYVECKIELENVEDNLIKYIQKQKLRVKNDINL